MQNQTDQKRNFQYHEDIKTEIKEILPAIRSRKITQADEIQAEGQ
jgi:ribosomal protein S20